MPLGGELRTSSAAPPANCRCRPQYGNPPARWHQARLQRARLHCDMHEQWPGTAPTTRQPAQ
eukprot:1588272-Alexandrium_andersonii.AAC.1